MLTKETILAFINSNRKTLEERYFVEKIALFGSFARDEQTEKSYIDLLITLEKKQ